VPTVDPYCSWINLNAKESLDKKNRSNQDSTPASGRIRMSLGVERGPAKRGQINAAALYDRPCVATAPPVMLIHPLAPSETQHF
jgi:hypothetical protein